MNDLEAGFFVIRPLQKKVVLLDSSQNGVIILP